MRQSRLECAEHAGWLIELFLRMLLLYDAVLLVSARSCVRGRGRAVERAEREAAGLLIF